MPTPAKGKSTPSLTKKDTFESEITFKGNDTLLQVQYDAANIEDFQDETE